MQTGRDYYHVDSGHESWIGFLVDCLMEYGWQCSRHLPLSCYLHFDWDPRDGVPWMLGGTVQVWGRSSIRVSNESASMDGGERTVVAWLLGPLRLLVRRTLACQHAA